MSTDDQSDSQTKSADAEISPREKAMGFFDHLEDLRWTLIKCTITFVVFASLIGYFLLEFKHVLEWPLTSVWASYPGRTFEKLGTVTIMEGFNVAIQMCIFGGFFLAAPFCLFFVAQFVSPALTKKEMKAVLPMCVAAGILFAIGATFSFLLLVPSTVKVSIELNDYFEYTTRWTPGSYYSMLTWLVLGTGASFEFPLVILLLVWLGLISTAFLRKYRRHAIVLIFIIAAVVTPTPDPFIMTIYAVPLYLLYELAILASTRVEKRRTQRNNS